MNVELVINSTPNEVVIGLLNDKRLIELHKEKNNLLNNNSVNFNKKRNNNNKNNNSVNMTINVAEFKLFKEY